MPITSLKSKAPIASVNEAFNKAFGESAKVTVDGEGNMTATVENNHMVINMMGEYHANVLTVEGADISLTRQSSLLQHSEIRQQLQTSKCRKKCNFRLHLLTMVCVN